MRERKKINGKNMSAGKFMGRNYRHTSVWIDGYSYATHGGKIGEICLAKRD
jgi:hypothetical protein